jgi:hypothetical protein
VRTEVPVTTRLFLAGSYGARLESRLPDRRLRHPEGTSARYAPGTLPGLAIRRRAEGAIRYKTAPGLTGTVPVMPLSFTADTPWGQLAGSQTVPATGTWQVARRRP